MASEERFRGVVHANPGSLLRGGVRVARSVWFDTKEEAEGWVIAMVEGQEDVVGYTNVLTWSRNKFTERWRP